MQEYNQDQKTKLQEEGLVERLLWSSGYGENFPDNITSFTEAKRQEKAWCTHGTKNVSCLFNAFTSQEIGSSTEKRKEENIYPTWR